MKKDFYQSDKDQIFENANNRNLFIKFKGEKYPAKIYGRLLDYPVISIIGNSLIDVQINWYQAERLANGLINTIQID